MIFDGNLFDSAVFDADADSGDTAIGGTLRTRRKRYKVVDYGRIIRSRVKR